VDQFSFFLIRLYLLECIASVFTLRAGIILDDLKLVNLYLTNGYLVFLCKLSGDFQKLFGTSFPGFEFGQN